MANISCQLRAGFGIGRHIRNAGKNSWQDFGVFAKKPGFNRSIVVEQINFSAGVSLQYFSEQNEMAVAVIPITHAFGAITVGRETRNKITDVFFSGSRKKRAVVARRLQRERGKNRVAEAYGI